MAVPEKDIRLVRKKFEDKTEKVPDKIRLGNHFVDDFIFEDHQAADIPINALRVIFNIISKFWQINKDVIPKLIVPISKRLNLWKSC